MIFNDGTGNRKRGNEMGMNLRIMSLGGDAESLCLKVCISLPLAWKMFPEDLGWACLAFQKEERESSPTGADRDDSN